MKRYRCLLLILITLFIVNGASALLPDEIDFTTDHIWIEAGVDTASYTVAVEPMGPNSTVELTKVEFSCLDPEFLKNGAGDTIGVLSPPVDDRGTDGYQATFWTHKSGIATIQATAYYLEDIGGGTMMERSVAKTLDQKIDHTIPYRFSVVDYESEITVATNSTIALQMEDKFGNIIDSRHEEDDPSLGDAEEVKLICAPADSGFREEDGSLTGQITKQVDSNGDIAVTFTAQPSAGENFVWLEAVLAVPKMWLTIYSVGEATPEIVETMVIPSTRRVPGDGDPEHYFTLLYTFYDRYGNPSPNSPIDIDTSLLEHTTIITNEFGEATIKYGPKNTIGRVDLIARSQLNPAVYSEEELKFTSLDGSSFDLVVNPSNLPSYEVDPFTPGIIYAKLTDDTGEGVPNEAITISINSTSITNNTPLASPPKIASAAADPAVWTETTLSNLQTDENGYVTVLFRSGGFPTDGEDGYSVFARGNCTVSATWKGYTKVSDPIEWRNYPYLRVETEVSNPSPKPGEDFDITLKLIGDGFGLVYRDPIDVVIATSRAYKMLQEEPDRLTFTFQAEHAFIDKLEQTVPKGGNDAIALLTFGAESYGNADILNMDKFKKLAGDDNTESDDAGYVSTYYTNNGNMVYDNLTVWEQTFTSNLIDIEGAIEDTIPFQDKGVDGETPVMPLRMAIYDAITQLRTQSNSMKAIVLLVDSQITWYGDVLAQGSYTYAYDSLNGGTNQYFPFPGPDGSWDPDKDVEPRQNMANYAKSENVKIYVVYAASDINNADKVTLSTLATESGGAFNDTSGDASKLEDIYEWIADQLIKEAAVDTSMNIQLVNFTDPADALNWSASEILDYVYADGESTRIKYYDWSINPYTPDSYLNNTPLTIDQTNDWAGISPPLTNLPASNLHFDIGNISIKQTWMTTFRMHVNESVNETINFGLFHPNSSISFTNQDGTTTMPMPETMIKIIPNMTETTFETVVLSLDNLRIIDQSPDFITFAWDLNYTGEGDLNEKMEYRPDDAGYALFDFKTVPGSSTYDTTPLDIRGFPRKEYYMRVSVSSIDAGMKAASIAFDLRTQDVPYIKIT